MVRTGLALAFLVSSLVPVVAADPVDEKADLAKHIQNIETVRNRINDLRKQGKSKEEVAKLIKIDDLGWQPSPFFSQRTLPGLYDELAR